MNDDERDILLNRLLAGRDEPSVVEREALWARIEADVRAARPKRLWFGGFGLMAVAAAALYVFYAPDPQFGVRGGDRATLELSCLRDDVPSACAPGATLVLAVGVPESKPYVSAFLERPDRTIEWISPAPGERSAPLDASKTIGVLLRDEHPPGESVAVLVFTPGPVSREAVKRGLEGEPPESWDTIERAFEVVKEGRE